MARVFRLPLLVAFFVAFVPLLLGGRANAAPLAPAAPAQPAKAVLTPPGTATAADVAEENRLKEREEERTAPDSPRASLSEFFGACREGRFEEAARFLELPRARTDGPRLAQRLDAVLRRRLLLDLDEVSPLSGGASDDGLSPGVDEVGRIPTATNPKGDPVRMVRRVDSEGTARWQLSSATVERIDRWYDALEDRWLRERLPEVLLRPGPREVLWWQWLAFPVIALLAYVLGLGVTRMMRPALDKLPLQSRIGVERATYAERLRAPVRATFAVVFAACVTPLLALDRGAQMFVSSVLRAAFEIAVFWILVSFIDAASRGAGTSTWGKAHPTGASLMPLVGKLAKIALVVIATVALLSQLGFAVGSIVAGLGIGGLAFALAAQKTVENLFGGVSMGIDQPFAIGDYVTVDGNVSGTVESLGLRSTRLRTQDRTLVTIPNGKLAEMRIENFGARDRFRMNVVLPLRPNTPTTVIATILQRIEDLLRSAEGGWPGDAFAIVREFGKDSTDLEANVVLVMKDFAAFREARKGLLLRIARIVEESGATFADRVDDDLVDLGGGRGTDARGGVAAGARDERAKQGGREARLGVPEVRDRPTEPSAGSR